MKSPNKRISAWIYGVLGCALAATAPADQPYSGNVVLKDEGPTLAVSHHHNRSRTERGLKAWYESFIPNFEDCDWSASNQGILRIRRPDERVFCTAVPALTHLWLSPDEQYIVGLSTIRGNNPYQLVVYTTSGELIYRRSIDCLQLASACRESVSQYIYWFHETHPGVRLTDLVNGNLELSLHDLYKARLQFEFPKQPAAPLDLTPCGRNWQAYSAEAFWGNYAFGHTGILEEHDDVICIYNRRKYYDEYFYIPREAFEDRAIKQQMFLIGIEAVMEGFERYPDAPADDYAIATTALKRITGLEMPSKEDWLTWWQQAKGKLVLSDDGTHLIIDTQKKDAGPG